LGFVLLDWMCQLGAVFFLLDCRKSWVPDLFLSC